jgi:hypothetical protein
LKQTLVEIQVYLRQAAERGKEPQPRDMAAIINRRLNGARDREKYLRGMGDFIGQALSGAILIPEKWTPPD